ncbi:antitoxin [Kingella oralis]|uniref:antitoxin n=2 Tax=Kingella oralis TaxID=505 RepID=UPI0034E5A3C8
MMQTIPILTTEHNQIIHLPQAFQFHAQEVIIQHLGNGVLLMPKNNNWQSLREAVAEFEPDFVLERGEQA